jgi:hypothetical protein
MKSRILVLSAVALVMVGWPTVALAQRTSGGAATTGTAVPRGGDSGGGAVSSGSGSSGGGSGGGATSSGGSAGMSSAGSSSSPSAPMHLPGEAGVRRAPGGVAGGATPIGIPEQSRPRGDHPSQGQAMARPSPTAGTYPISSGGYAPADYWSGFGNSGSYYPGYYYQGYGFWPYGPYGYSSWGYWPYGYGMYGLGLGYLFYDPLSYPFWAYGYGYGGGYGGADAPKTEGSIKLKVKPADAQVFVDGAYVGRVNDFDGVFQHLDLEPGAHRIEIKADGYQPLTFEVRSLPGRTITYEGELKR